MKEIEIIEVPQSEADLLEKACIDLRQERYFTRLKNSKRRISVLFSDLSWLRKHFGVDRNESSVITINSLNSGRRNEIAAYMLCVKHNCPMWELGKIDVNGKIKIKGISEDKFFGTLKEKKQYYKEHGIGKPVVLHQLGESASKRFQANIDEGLMILCKYV